MAKRIVDFRLVIGFTKELKAAVLKIADETQVDMSATIRRLLGEHPEVKAKLEEMKNG